MPELDSSLARSSKIINAAQALVLARCGKFAESRVARAGAFVVGLGLRTPGCAVI
jgi:hypothetical protein